MSAFLPGINLPWFITLHAFGLLAVGLNLVLRSPQQPQQPQRQQQRPQEQHERRQPPSPLLGIATVALSLAYLGTAYMPMEQNAFLYASVPIRMLLALLAAGRLAMGARGEDWVALVLVAGYDGVGGKFFFVSSSAFFAPLCT